MPDSRTMTVCAENFGKARKGLSCSRGLYSRVRSFKSGLVCSPLGGQSPSWPAAVWGSHISVTDVNSSKENGSVHVDLIQLLLTGVVETLQAVLRLTYNCISEKLVLLLYLYSSLNLHLYLEHFLGSVQTLHWAWWVVARLQMLNPCSFEIKQCIYLIKNVVCSQNTDHLETRKYK